VNRPSWIPVPGFALRVLFGEIADYGLITGQRVVPARALSLGFTFKYPDIDSALVEAFRPGRYSTRSATTGSTRST
jgi:NAD dependent epimerase/dehydratase family enzyme